MLDATLLAVIDQRIQAAATATNPAGTVMSVDTTNLRAMVTFDGSSLAVPVKMFGHIDAAEGDRVGLQRFGTDWVIVGAYARRWQAVSGAHQLSAGGTMSSTTYADLPGSPSFTFTKRWATSAVLMGVHSEVLTDTANTKAVFGLEWIDSTGTTLATYNLAWLEMVAAFTVGTISGLHHGITGITAGAWTVKGKWARWLGAGAIGQNTDVGISIFAMEVN